MIKETVQKEMECIVCLNRQIIHRKEHKNKKVGHRKGLWCHVCKRKTKHVELPEFRME